MKKETQLFHIGNGLYHKHIITISDDGFYSETKMIVNQDELTLNDFSFIAGDIIKVLLDTPKESLHIIKGFLDEQLSKGDRA